MIELNAAKCLACGDIVESTHRHDYVTCMCGNLAVDGGLDYLRRVAKDAGFVQELSVERPEPGDGGDE